MLGLSHRLLLPPELTEHLQITGRLFIYLYTCYISHQIKLALDFRPFSASRGCNLHRRSWNFLGEEIPRGKTIPNQVDDFSWNWSPNPGITENHKISQSQLGFVFFIFFSTDSFGNSPHVGSWLYESSDEISFAPLEMSTNLVWASCWQTPSLSQCGFSTEYHQNAHIKELIIFIIQNLVTSDSFMHSFGSLWKTWSWSICLLTTLECMGKPSDNKKPTEVFVWYDATTPPKSHSKKDINNGTLSLLAKNYKDYSHSPWWCATSEHHIDFSWVRQRAISLVLWTCAGARWKGMGCRQSQKS